MRRAVFLMALLASPAAAFTAENGQRVTGSADGFTVSWQGKSGPTDFWCAAGDYAIRKLHLSPTTRIYRASEPPRRAGEAVRFTVSAGDAARKSGLITLGPDDAGRAAGQAQSLCEIRHHRF